MTEYIERERMWRKVNRAKNIEEALSLIDSMPAADVKEVKHGKWTSNGLRNPQCSLCLNYSIEKTRFCPDCGARMDGEGEWEIKRL